MGEKVNLEARLAIDNSEVFARLEKTGNLALGEISDFAEDFCEKIVEATASKMLLEYLKGEFPSINVSVDVGHYNDFPFTISNPVNGILSDPLLSIMRPEPLLRRIYDCVDEDCYDSIKPRVVMLLLEVIESSISE